MTDSALGAVLDSIEGGTITVDATNPSGLAESGHVSISQRARAARNHNGATYNRDLLEVAALYGQVLKGSRSAASNFVEAMTTSDFSNLFGDIIDRQLFAKYVSKRADWREYVRRATVNDFRTVKRFTLDGGEAFLSQVNESAPYTSAALTDNEFSYKLAKYGRVLGLSWESIINDDLDAFRDMPDRLANAAIRSEDKFVTDLYAAAAGPDATFFSTGNRNLVTAATSALSLSSLNEAFTLLGEQVDTDGGPIYVEGVVLVVPPALEITARNLLEGSMIHNALGSGGAVTDSTARDQLVAPNWMRNRTKLVVNPMIPLISTTGTVGRTSWYLFAEPSTGRPAAEVGFLRGRETPELFAKDSDARRIGGGQVNVADGDFYSDQVLWKVRHSFGGVLVDPKMAVGAKGQA